MFRFSFSILFILFLVNIYLSAQEYSLTDKEKTGLLICLKHKNDGVRSSGVYFVGKYKVEEAIPHLCKILKNDTNLRIRKLAAFSLYRLGRFEGLVALKEALAINDSKEVRLFCKIMVDIAERE